MQVAKQCYKVVVVPLFVDNYSYIVQGTSPKSLVLIDPASPNVIVPFLKQQYPHYTVSHVLYTHKHGDHAGGSLQLYNQLKLTNVNLKLVIGEYDFEAVEGANYKLQNNASLTIGESKVQTLHVPCHTKGHTIYYFRKFNAPKFEDKKIQTQTIEGKTVRTFHSQECLFTGDTLFIGGVGRFFEGDAQQMTTNIKNILEYVNEQADLYCGHEYTLQNLKWAKEVEKENIHIQTYYQQLSKIQKQFGSGAVCSLPSSLKKQKLINVFVRSVIGALPSTMAPDSVKLLQMLRQMKNKNITNYNDYVH